MNKKTLVIGGCRSGKSSHALELAEKISAGKKIFIATGVPFDNEMKQRIARHQEERSRSWFTIEAPVHLPEVIVENNHKENVILVDCLTLWINNLLLENDDQENIAENIKKLVEAVKKAQCPIIMVSNEVGTGIVPENRLARLFRDSAGFVNQRLAACSDNVIWIVAGIPVKIK